MMKLLGFFRSGSSHRARIALGLKGVAYENVPVNLRDGKHKESLYTALNPQGLVPTLVLDDGTALSQSPAIIEYLEEYKPDPPFLPTDPIERAQARGMAALIGCDIHPINNLRVLNALRGDFGADEETVSAWCRRWIRPGFDALEAMLEQRQTGTRYSFGDAPGLVEIYLVPQVFSAARFGLDMSAYPRIRALDTACASLPAFRDGAPGNQPDAV